MLSVSSVQSFFTTDGTDEHGSLNPQSFKLHRATFNLGATYGVWDVGAAGVPGLDGAGAGGAAAR